METFFINDLGKNPLNVNEHEKNCYIKHTTKNLPLHDMDSFI